MWITSVDIGAITRMTCSVTMESIFDVWKLSFQTRPPQPLHFNYMYPKNNVEYDLEILNSSNYWYMKIKISNRAQEVCEADEEDDDHDSPTFYDSSGTKKLFHFLTGTHTSSYGCEADTTSDAILQYRALHSADVRARME